MPFYAPTRQTEQQWQGSPLAPSRALLATSVPPVNPRIPRQWGFNLPPDQTWQWTNGWASDALTSLTIGGAPFHKEWRYDYDSDPTAWQWAGGWNADPLVMQAAGGSPFYRQWRYDCVPDPNWT